MIIAIDGPAGSGKSTVAKRVAAELGFRYLDTGAMYRAVAVQALRDGVPVTDEDRVAAIASTERVSFMHAPGASVANRVYIGTRDVTDEIRTPAADDAVSAVARLPRVRNAMVAQQREIGGSRDIVVEGRDIGTVVFPDADVKVFLTASPEERARRRAEEQAERGHSVVTEEVAHAMAKRDESDSTRATSPLVAATDALRLDTTALSIDDVVARIVDLARTHR
jgi:cytidylate kinase